MAKLEPVTENAFVGSAAPEFTLQNEGGTPTDLKEVLAKGPALVVFYPGDFTPVCTKQLCSYQDSIESFKRFGVQLVGISKNSPQEHRKFKEHYKFEFPLLS